MKVKYLGTFKLNRYFIGIDISLSKFEMPEGLRWATGLSFERGNKRVDRVEFTDKDGNPVIGYWDKDKWVLEYMSPIDYMNKYNFAWVTFNAGFRARTVKAAKRIIKKYLPKGEYVLGSRYLKMDVIIKNKQINKKGESI
jgi:hypothetical protein